MEHIQYREEKGPYTLYIEDSLIAGYSEAQELNEALDKADHLFEDRDVKLVEVKDDAGMMIYRLTRNGPYMYNRGAKRDRRRNDRRMMRYD